jgi:hypothetical protein
MLAIRAEGTAASVKAYNSGLKAFIKVARKISLSVDVMIMGYPLDIQERQKIWDFVSSGRRVRLLGEMLVPNDMYYIEVLDPNRYVSIYLKGETGGMMTGYIARADKELKMASIMCGGSRRS